MDKKIISNKAQCRHCGTIIESKTQNDFKRCTCGKIAVDGGHEYIKRLENEENIIELSEYFENFKSDNHISSNSNSINPLINISSQSAVNNLQPAINVNNNLNNQGLNNLSIQLRNFNQSILPIISTNYFSIGNQLIEKIKPIVAYQLDIMNNTMKTIIEQVNPMQKIIESISETLKPALLQITDSLPKMSDYFEELSKSMERARENPNSMLNWMDYSEKLCKYIWTIPYDISSEELKKLTSSVNSEKEFDKYMIKYFNKLKMDNLFDDILKRLNRKHKVMVHQIRNAYDCKSYSLANVGILSIIDELCFQFLLDKGCVKRKDILLPIIDEIDNISDDVFEVIPILILNNNLNIIYETIDFNHKIKIKTNKKVRRNPSQHGQSFSNRKIDTIMLLNTIYYLLIIMEEYKQYIGKIIYVKNQTELVKADTEYCSVIKRFYLKKKYVRTIKINNNNKQHKN